MDSKTFIESGALEAYVMGLATEQEAKLVMEMVARYPEVNDELRAVEESMENFDQKNAIAPPVELKEKILTRIGSSGFPVSGSASSTVVENQPKVRTLNDSSNGAIAKQSSFFKYAAAVALLLFVASAYYNYSLSRELKDKESELVVMNQVQKALDATMTDRDRILQEKQSMEEQMALLKKPSMKSIELKGMDVAPDAKAMVYANTTSGEAYLEIMNLPPAPEGMQYQFWGIVDGKPVDAGMIPLDGDQTGMHPMKTVTNSTAYAISLEKKGGSTQPEGKIFVMGNV